MVELNRAGAPTLLLCLCWDSNKAYGNMLEIRLKKSWLNWDFATPQTECSAVPLFSQSTCDLSVAAWPAGGAAGPIYWQAQGRENAISWQKTSHPEQTLISAQTYTASHLHGLALLSVYLRATQETSSPSALIQHVCMQAVVRHVITLCGVFICLWFSPPQEAESLLPCELQCVFRGRTCIFKTQPWAHCCPVPFPLISQGCGGLSGPGDRATEKKSKKIKKK